MVSQNPLFILYHYGQLIWDSFLNLSQVFMMPMNSPEFAAAVDWHRLYPGNAPLFERLFNDVLTVWINIAGDMSIFEFVLLMLPIILIFYSVTMFIVKLL